MAMKRKCLPRRRITAWIDDARRWTVGGLPAAMRIALDKGYGVLSVVVD